MRARGERGLFAGAARGMFSLLADLSQVSADRAFRVELSALDLETLLIDWLNELLYLAEDNGVVFVAFDIQRLDREWQVRLLAEARGGEPPALRKAIKAATFSGLSIRRRDHMIEAELVFDV